MQRSRPLAAATLSLIPSPVLARLTILLNRAMRRRHPKLVANFARLDPAVVHVFPNDLPHRFAIEFGGGKMDVRVLRDDAPKPPDAEIRGNLMALIDLLEGRIDGDAMFFSREIEITGSTAVIVAVRNTLDREEIVITDEIAAMFGPLERPARRTKQQRTPKIARSKSTLELQRRDDDDRDGREKASRGKADKKL